ncbi:DDE-type integrase/transposase/recombinase [Clostridium tagluense]|uniref:DDE-type integrase/transposase/recombinase n=1 Tax=Clostridium tagluense TaxID=360422 RepID=UPI001C0ADF6A|nr:DDE-type integrase/transposase/recombinase [Clostridium tagluense]MBU3126126.1 DDE-type integrase/transposase/recombinase [Clostridium tagluense]
MSTIISILVTYNQLLLSQINQLLIFIAKNIPLKAPKYDMTSPKYKKLTVDKLPIIKTFEKLDYKQMLKEYKIANGKDKKPVNPRGKNPVAPDTVCPRCDAPHNYIYDNAGGRGQLCCKVCDLHFSKNKVDLKTELFICPFCGHALSKKKDRKHFFVHKCVNNKCDFYLNSLAKLSLEDLEEYKKDKHKFKLHYIYREFTTDFFDVDLYSMPKGATSLKFRNFSSHVMGLCLTYNVNLGLSTRRTALALWEIHGVKISHVMVSRYAITAAAMVKPFVDNYDYKPTNYLSADETYTKVKGVHQYIWFVMDAIKKSILGYQASFTRDTGPCILTMRMAFDKFKEFPGKSLKFIADGYTAYKLAQQQFNLNGFDFDVTQVIGLTNSDPVSTEYRWVKQIIERLNRTFKFSYRVTNGFGSEEGSNTHLALFVAYYNFLRPHSYAYWEPLNSIPELEKIPTMPGKWQKLIELSQHLILEKQLA